MESAVVIPPPRVPKVRKHLSSDALYALLKARFATIPDHREVFPFAPEFLAKGHPRILLTRQMFLVGHRPDADAGQRPATDARRAGAVENRERDV